MNITSMYSVKIKEYRHIFKESVEQYRSAADFFINVCLKEWDRITLFEGLKAKHSLLCFFFSIFDFSFIKKSV